MSLGCWLAGPKIILYLVMRVVVDEYSIKFHPVTVHRGPEVE